MKKEQYRTILIIVVVTFTFETAAKMQVRHIPPPYIKSGRYVVHYSVSELENHLRPYLEARIDHQNNGKLFVPQQIPGENVFLQVAKNWGNLSKEFKTLYKSATSIPAGYLYFTSPGEHFEIYYTTNGIDSVNGADVMSYGIPGNWRTRNNVSNGVPDYIDEVAWACDSAWSMEIDRFKYHTPYPYKDPQHASDRMKIVVCCQGTGFYGQTIPNDHSDSAKGFRSYFEINNDWSDPSWSSMGYTTHPENAVRITCIHEFFHTIQYAMCNQITNGYIPDDYPVSWLEGTAVLRERQGFDSVKDYLQYTGDFFDNPQMPFLCDSVPNIYTNALLAIFLAQFYSIDDYDDFIRRVFFTGYQSVLPFSENLTRNSFGMATQWVTILNDFGTRSYFTGSRSHDGYFLKDAPIMSQWSYSPVSLDKMGTAHKQVAPYGMQIFAVTHQQVQGDSLSIFFKGETFAQDSITSVPIWAASYILRRPTSDTFSTIHIMSNTGNVKIPEWGSCSGILVIASNGDNVITRNATVSFQTCPLTYVSGTYYFKTKTENDSAIVMLKTQTDLYCSLTVKPVQTDSLLESAKNNQLAPVTGFYEISFPLTWSYEVVIDLAINAPASPYSNAKNLFLYEWSGTDSRWNIIQNSASISSISSLHFDATIKQPGIYAAFAPITPSQISIVVYPNPAHSRMGDLMHFTGTSIYNIQIYSVDGSLICKAGDNLPHSNALQQDAFQYTWNLTNSSGISVAPGIYLAVMKVSDSVTENILSRKLMILP